MLGDFHMIVLEDDDRRIAFLKRAVCDNVTVTRTVPECIECLRGSEGHYLSLDHDLGGEEFVDSARKDCGMEVIRWLAKQREENPDALDWLHTIVCHSHNVEAREAMVAALHAAGYDGAQGLRFYNDALRFWKKERIGVESGELPC